MNNGALIDGLLLWIAFVALVALHEFAHAWTAQRCGDDTPRLQGRLTLNPLAHVDLIGTFILPLLVTLLSAMGGRPMLFGWGRPVEVNLNNFRQRRRDDILVSGAGPAMNLVVTILLLGLMKVMELAGADESVDSVLHIARLSLFLCFFNLLPIPPLDGGHILRNLVGMSDEVYHLLSQYSFLFLLIILRVPAVGVIVSATTDSVLALLALPFGWHLTMT
jgi:Zn-dependent protease